MGYTLLLVGIFAVNPVTTTVANRIINRRIEL